MRDYSKISPAFWTGQTGRQIRNGGTEAIIVSLYLLTSPHANMLGMYYCPIAYICNDTGLGPQGASKGLRRAIEAHLCAYDHETEVVWVYEMARYQIEERLKPNDKRVFGIRKEYERLPKCPFLSDFFDKYKVDFHLDKRRGFEAPSKPHRSQEQEQEQEQDIEESSLRSDSSCPEPSTGSVPAEPKPAVTASPVMEIPLNLKGKFFKVTEADIDQWQETFPAVDVMAALRECRQWNIDNPAKRKTANGIRTHISAWIAREQNRGGVPRSRARKGGPVPYSVKDALIIQNEQIARALNEDERRKQQQGIDPAGCEAGGLLLEHPLPGGGIRQ